jgi:hypothetical protein
MRGMHYDSATDGGTANGVFIASKAVFFSESRRPLAGAGVLRSARFERFTLLGCYFPQHLSKLPFFTRCGKIVVEFGVKPLLLLGDMTTGNQIADKDIAGGLYHYAGAFDQLSSKHQLHDLWRRSNWAEAREWKWLSDRKTGFRIDHAFGNATFVEWAVPNCRYGHTPRGILTDHG